MPSHFMKVYLPIIESGWSCIAMIIYLHVSTIFQWDLEPTEIDTCEYKNVYLHECWHGIHKRCLPHNEL